MLMDADGSNMQQLTHFSTPGYRESQPNHTVAAVDWFIGDGLHLYAGTMGPGAEKPAWCSSRSTRPSSTRSSGYGCMSETISFSHCVVQTTEEIVDTCCDALELAARPNWTHSVSVLLFLARTSQEQPVLAAPISHAPSAHPINYLLAITGK
jgi:hypothetical protein